MSIDATNTEDALKYWNTKEAFFISELRGNKPQRIRLGCLGLQIGKLINCIIKIKSILDTILCTMAESLYGLPISHLVGSFK